MSLTAARDAVRAFHHAFRHSAPDRPTKQTVKAAKKRSKWIKSEARELDAARTLVDQADAYADIFYFTMGGFVELGIDPQPLFDIVHNANMAKLWADGQPHYHPDGKVKKPEGWQKPEPLLAAEIERQLAAT